MTGSTRAAAPPDRPAPDHAGLGPDHAGPAADQGSRAADRAGPAADQGSRAADRAGPAADQGSRAADRAGPAADQGSRAADRAGPAADRAGPAADQAGSAAPDRPGARAPGRPRSAEAEKAILDATIELLLARGMSGLSFEAVAARAGVAKTTIYRRWPDKEELALAAVTAAKGPPPEPPGRSVRGDLLHLLHGVGRGRDGSPDNWSALMSRLSMESEAYPDLVYEAWRRAIGPRRTVFARVLARAVEEGLIRPDADLDLVADMLIAPVAGKVRPARPPLTEPQVATVVDIILRGLAPLPADLG